MTWERAETIALLDDLDELIRRAGGVPLTDQVRLDRGKIDSLLERLRTAVRGGPLELSHVIDELDALVQGAKSVPMTNEIRVGREEIYDRLDRLRAGCATPSREHLPPEVAGVLGELDEFLSTASLVPLTAQVRLDRAQAYALLDRLRAAFRDPSAEVAAALDDLDKLVRGARGIPFTNQIRVGMVDIYETLDRIGAE